MNSNFEPIKKAAIDAAKSLGIREYELYYSEGASVSADTYKDEISAFSSDLGGYLSFRCIVDGKMGYASTQKLTIDEVTELVERAAENAQYIERDEEAIIFGGAKPEDYHAVPSCDFTMPEAAAVKNAAMDCRNTVYAADKLVSDGTECGAYASENVTYLVNSNGLDLESHAGTVAEYMYAILDDGSEKVWGYDTSYGDFGKCDRSELAGKVIDEARSKLGAVVPPTGSYNIVFSSKQMSAILSTFVSVFFAENAQKGLSLLKGKVGEKIAADCVNINDDPFHPANPKQINFDGEGVPARKKAVIENGVLKTLLYNLSSAKKDGVETTGNASRSGASIGTKTFWFCIEPGEVSLDDLFAKAGTGIYVTEMKGFHAGANAVTGDFSIESAGFLIENGVKSTPVKSFTIAGNFFDLIKKIDTLSSDIDYRGPSFSKIAAPALLVRDMPVAGK